MKRFKKFYESFEYTKRPTKYQILKPEAEEYSKFEYKGRRVMYSQHAMDRFNERNRIPQDKLVWFYKNVIDWLTIHGGESYYGYYLLFSKKLNQGIIVSWESDNYNFGLSNKPSINKHMLITTFLPYGKNDPDYGAKPDKPTKLIMMEHKLQNGYISRAMAKYLSSIMDIPVSDGKIMEKHPDGISNYSKKFDNVDVTIFTIGNKVWDVDGVMIGEVE